MQQKTLWMVLLLMLVVTCATSAQTESTLPPDDTIIARMAQARAENQACFRPFVVTRDYKLYGRDQEKAKSQVVADVAFTPPDTKTYTIQQANGSGMGKSVIRRTLAGEVAIAKDYVLTDFSADNYDFRFTREEYVGGRRFYELELLPRREDKNLLRGTIWIDAITYLPGRVRGEPAKSPSWWLREVSITLLYGDVSGMWLQTNLEVTASVWILGPHTLVSQDLEYRMSEPIVASCPTRDSATYTTLISSVPIHPSAFRR